MLAKKVSQNQLKSACQHVINMRRKKGSLCCCSDSLQKPELLKINHIKSRIYMHALIFTYILRTPAHARQYFTSRMVFEPKAISQIKDMNI